MARPTAASSTRFRRVLIIKPSSLGDIIHALPVLAAIRQAHPQAHVAWLANTTFAPLLDGHPLLDEVIPFDRRHYGRMLRSPRALRDFIRFLWQLRNRRFDLVLDLQGLFRSGILTWATGAHVRLGFADAREGAYAFYSQRIPGSRKDCHAVEMNLLAAEALGLPAGPPTFPLGLLPGDLETARQLLAAVGGRPIDRFTAVVPGARWDTKRWPMSRLAAVIDRLHAQGGAPCVLLGAPDDRTEAEQIIAHARTKTRIVNLVGRTSLRQLAATLALADLVLCHDSGPMHIAAALNKPIVAIFGPTDPARTGPYCQTARIAALPLPCRPCLRRQCPLQHHDCMQKLDIETVLSLIQAARTDTAAHHTTAPAHT